MMRILILGAGGHGCSVAEAVQMAGGFEIVGFLDDSTTPPKMPVGLSVIGPISGLHRYRGIADGAVVAIGNNRAREIMHASLAEAGLPLVTIVHPRAFVSPSATLGRGCTVMAGSVIGTAARLGEGVVVNCGAVADHHCVIEDFGHLGVNACMAGEAVLGRSGWMQAGAAAGYGVHIPAGAVLAPGVALAKA